MIIGLFTSVYFNNIGNGFIDLGAEEAIKAAMSENDELIKVSQCANFAASMGRTFMLKENPVINWGWTHVMKKAANKLHDKSYKAVNTLDVFSAVSLFEFDYLIIPGCVLTVPFFTIYGKLLEDKVSQGCRLVFLGVSGNYYTDYEIEYVTAYLNRLHPYAIMTRDTIAFEHYSKYASRVYNGIDNAFFLNKLNIPKLKTDMNPYVVVNIEEPPHNILRKNLLNKLCSKNINVIFSNHKPFPYTKINKLVKTDRMLISDYPLDYLVLYRNAELVYSDRVHACISTLSFGNKAILYSDTPRKALFENVGIKWHWEEPMYTKDLESRQEAQIDFLKKVIMGN